MKNLATMTVFAFSLTGRGHVAEKGRFAPECLGEGDRTQHRAGEVVWPRSEALAGILQAVQGGVNEPKGKKAIAETMHAAQKYSAIILIYAAKNTEHNEAVVLQTLFKRKAGA